MYDGFMNGANGIFEASTTHCDKTWSYGWCFNF